MEHVNFLAQKVCEIIKVSIYYRKSGKLSRTLYAGLVVCFVPSILCQEWSRRLTFDEIYNDTSYAQLQKIRPYRITEYSYDISHIHPIDNGRNRHNADSGRVYNKPSFNVDDKIISNHQGLGLNINYGTAVDSTETNIEDKRIANLEDYRRIVEGTRGANSHIRNEQSYAETGDHRLNNDGTISVSNGNIDYYDKIVNSHGYNGGDSRFNDQRHLFEDTRENLSLEFIPEVNEGNELELDSVTGTDIVKEPLLVGFSHDPFRYSVPEEDYLKGVRDMTPKSIMNKGENRGKRGVLHLYNMMYCATGCEPLSYKGYGCYCGFLGSGRPVDGIDRCCKIHDECYENIYCPFYTVYFQPYYWKCYRGQPLCALENYHTRHQFINGCAARLCECDRQFAMCVKRYSCPRRRALCHSSPLRLLQNLLMNW